MLGNYSKKAFLLLSLALGSTGVFAAAEETRSAWTNHSTMDLGRWRHSIAERINPKFFGELDMLPDAQNKHFLSYRAARLYFDDIDFKQLLPLTQFEGYFFTFDYDKSVLRGVNFHQSLFKFDNLRLLDKDFFTRSYVAPGISYRVNERSEYSLSVLFAQQNYSDMNFLASEVRDYDQLDLYSVNYGETSSGLGIRLGASQRLFDWLNFSMNYQSKIDMDGFSRLLGVQADPADFDIPESLDFSVALQLGGRNTLLLNAKRSYYSDINAFVSRSFPNIFLTFLNDLESPHFQWDDHTVYSVALEHQFRGGTVINLEYSGRQQPSATDADLTTILNAISADYSIKMGLKAPLFGGELDLYASYAPKPLTFGRTDFGHVDGVLSGKHTEAVMAWIFHF